MFAFAFTFGKSKIKPMDFDNKLELIQYFHYKYIYYKY